MRFRFGSKHGMSLVELIITMAIMSIVTLGAFQVFQEGLQLFRTNQGANDAQSSAVKTLGLLTTELVNAHPDLVQEYSAPDAPGVVFASPLNANGQAQFNSDNGKVYWQKYVCYYFVPHPSDPARGKLYRKEETIPNEPAIESGRTGDSRLDSVGTSLGSYDTNYFAAASALPTRLLGDTVSGFEVSLFDGEIDNAGSTKSVLGGTGLVRENAYDIVLEAGDPNNNGPSGYYIRVDSRVAPRG